MLTTIVQWTYILTPTLTSVTFVAAAVFTSMRIARRRHWPYRSWPRDIAPGYAWMSVCVALALANGWVSWKVFGVYAARSVLG